MLKRLFPGGRNKLAFALDERQLDSFLIVGEVERVTALNAKKITVDAALVAIVAAHNLHAGIGAANAERRLASVATMGTNSADVLHLPGTSLITVGS